MSVIDSRMWDWSELLANLKNSHLFVYITGINFWITLVICWVTRFSNLSQLLFALFINNIMRVSSILQIKWFYMFSLKKQNWFFLCSNFMPWSPKIHFENKIAINLVQTLKNRIDFVTIKRTTSTINVFSHLH